MNLRALHWPTPHGKVVMIPGLGCCTLGNLECFCCVEKRLGEND